MHMDYKLVEVIWIDAEEHGDVGWNDLKSMKAYAKKPCPVMHTVGYVLHQSEEHIAVISTVGTDECSRVEKIPTEFVKEIKVIREENPRARSVKKKGK